MKEILAGALVALAQGSQPVADMSSQVLLTRSLSALRTHLEMEVAFISEISDGRRYFRYVDAQEAIGLVRPGASDPAEDSYCLRVLDGRLPELMPNACLNLEALTLAATRELPVGAHLSVPIRLADGRVYGTLCCFSRAANETLTQRDLGMMHVFADMVADRIQADLLAREARHAMEDRIDAALNADEPGIVYQPIFHVAEGRIVGFEALSRFSLAPQRTPDLWFAEASHVGRAVPLESKAIRAALTGLQHLPADLYIAVNASPETIVSGEFAGLLEGLPLERIVIEVTEHEAVEQYDEIAAVVGPLQAVGLRLAIDDAGAGYASFRHILNLHPHIIKLDLSITRAIDTDYSRRALAAAICGFAAATDCKIVAEGVETSGELAALRELGVNNAQGYFLSHPLSLGQALAFLQTPPGQGPRKPH